MTNVCIVTGRLDGNSLGRTYTTWLLCVAAGLPVRIVSGANAAPIWEPVRGTEFGNLCESLPANNPAKRDQLTKAIQNADLVIVTKAVPDSFGAVRKTLRTHRNVIIDVDDPDIEAETTWLSFSEQLRAATRDRYYIRLRRLRREVRRYRVIVSNPVLQEMYGGVIIPHVRLETPAGPHSSSHTPRVAFVGTPRAHKGINVLRSSISTLADDGYSLDVTAPPPTDRRPWERWHGVTGLQEGLEITANADIVAIPSLSGGYTAAQFPVKSIDAMLAARPVVASDVGPMRWILGGGGLLCPPGDEAALTNALKQLGDPERRQEIGQQGRAHALRSFTVSAVLPQFLQAIGISASHS